jgi:hypothetical protein
MDASLETLVVAACVLAATFRIPRPGPLGKVSDEEIVALAVAQAITGTASDRRFLGAIGRLLPGLFSDLPDQTQYNRRLTRLTPWITTVQLMLAELIAEGQVRFADGTLDRVRELSRVRVAQRVRRPRQLRLLPVQEPVHLGNAARAAVRSQGRPGRL